MSTSDLAAAGGVRAPARNQRYIGPPPLAPALAHVVLFVASIVVGASAGVFGRPYTAAAVLTANLAEHSGAARTVALLQVASGVALGVFTAAAVGAVRARTPRLAGLDIAFRRLRRGGAARRQWPVDVVGGTGRGG